MTHQEPKTSHPDGTPEIARLLPAPKTPDPTPTIRIYVACLAAYNNGILHGAWIDATQGEAGIWDDVRAMLAASPEPDAEEWAIHDYEGFEGALISEWTSFERITELAEFIEEHGELGGKLLEHFCGELDEARAAFEDYSGQHESLEYFAIDLTEQTGLKIPEGLQSYIDYASMGRDMEWSGDIFTIETAHNEVHVFWSR